MYFIYIGKALELTPDRAKRYERMLKNHGIHPNGGPLHDPLPPTRRRLSTPKTSKKRKYHDASPQSKSLKPDNDECQKPSMRRHPIPRNDFHHVKQEPPLMGFQPYMPYHQMMPHPHAFMHRQIPSPIQPGVPHMSHQSNQPHPLGMMSGLQPNNYFGMPHLHPPHFTMQQSMPHVHI